jgi:LysR family glycine cleavage system transcriptional activator
MPDMPRKTLPLYALSVFEVAARHQSFTHAANELFITQGAVSKQIAQLEDSLGYPLFHRYARSLRLTAQGSLLLGYVQRGFKVISGGGCSSQPCCAIVHQGPQLRSTLVAAGAAAVFA